MEIKSQSDAYVEHYRAQGWDLSDDGYYSGDWDVVRYSDPLRAFKDKEFQGFLNEAGLLEEERTLKESHHVLYHYTRGMRLYRDLISLLENKNFTFVRPPSDRYQTSIEQIKTEMATGVMALKRFKESLQDTKERADSLLLSGDVDKVYQTKLIGHKGEAIDKVEAIWHRAQILNFEAAIYSLLGSFEDFNDESSEVSRELLSCSPALYNPNSYESTYSMWKKRNNIKNYPKAELIAQVLIHYGLTQEHLPKLLELQAMMEPYDHAIVAIYLPKNKPELINRNVYVAKPFGRPEEKYPEVSEVFAQLQKTEGLEDRKDLQMRLLIRNDGVLDPESGIRVKVFDEISRETLAKYQEGLASWAASLELAAAA